MPISLVATDSTPEDEQQKMLQQLNQSKAKQGQPQVNLPQQKGPLSMMKDMATQRAMNAGLNTGEGYLTDAFSGMFAPSTVTAGQSAAMQSAVGSGMLNPAIANSVGAGTGAGAAAGLGAAVPYIGMGLLAGKAFGLFNEGGKVDLMKDPLANYKDDGGLIGPLALRKIKYKQNGGKIELELSGE